MNARRRVAISMIALLGTVAAKAPPYVYGPAPDWGRYKELGTAAVKAVLPDPDEWEVAWPNGYIQGYWTPGGRQDGYVTCASVRAIKPIAGGYPTYPFIVVIDQDRVKKLDLKLGKNALVEVGCRAAVQHGKMPPASMMPTGDAGQPSAITALGLTVRATPDGAYVVSATAGSVADRAGLKAGMVITKANGIALAGMGDAMTRLLASDSATLTLETAVGQQIVLKR